MQYNYTPRGVCSRKFTLDIQDDTLVSCEITGGCPGNSMGICSLIQGKNIDDIIRQLTGISCGTKPTSCPDQLAKALIEYKATL